MIIRVLSSALMTEPRIISNKKLDLKVLMVPMERYTPAFLSPHEIWSQFGLILLAG